MSLKNEMITAERVKSHLQKYRLNRERSKTEFLTSYDLALAGLKERGGRTNFHSGTAPCGELAAALTYQAMSPDKVIESSAPRSSTAAKYAGRSENFVTHAEDRFQSDENDGAILKIPHLTDAEYNSPLGTSLRYLTGLCQSMSEHMVELRMVASNNKRKEGARSESTTEVLEKRAESGTAAAPPDRVQSAIPDQHGSGSNMYSGGNISTSSDYYAYAPHNHANALPCTSDNTREVASNGVEPLHWSNQVKGPSEYVGRGEASRSTYTYNHNREGGCPREVDSSSSWTHHRNDAPGYSEYNISQAQYQAYNDAQRNKHPEHASYHHQAVSNSSQVFPPHHQQYPPPWDLPSYSPISNDAHKYGNQSSFTEDG